VAAFNIDTYSTQAPLIPTEVFPESLEHVQTQNPELPTCAQCGFIGRTQWCIEYHAQETNHAAFICPYDDCDSKFSRTDVMKRHCLNHKPDAPRYPCPHCKKYQGKFGFKRKDHLTQHLRGYHHIGDDNPSKDLGRSCTHPDCPSYRGPVQIDGSRHWLPPRNDDQPHAFTKAADWAKHMRMEHNESAFSCPVPGCDRVGGKGWFRKRDMVKHVGKTHPDFELDKASVSRFV